ncbi:MAG: phosphoribosylamine--glycine ligase, partial [Armatimonadetes bacterium]|nr:phosphoribosylamine--glycine ligase [Armatimonadota bacterium]
MDVLVVGGGGREHALVWGLARQGQHRLFAWPGNPGMASLATCLGGKVDDSEGIVATAVEKGIDLV